MAKVCETVTGRSMEELREARDRVTGADLVEVRLDSARTIDVRAALRDRRLPVIVTCRPVWEGGGFDGPEDVRLRILADAIAEGAEFVDVEWRADRRHLPASERTQIVLSHHDFSGLPEDLASRVRAMRREQTAFIKVAVTATRLADCVTLRRALADGTHQIGIAMGPAGQVTRVFPAWTESAWSYGGQVAPGQLAARDLLETYRVRQTTRHTTVFAVVGCPIAHSASPAMHNAAFQAAAIDALYVPLETADAEDFEALARELPLAGASVTAPLKRALAARCTRRDETAEATGAVNTLRREADGWVGRNFDVPAFLAPLDAVAALDPGDRAVVLGAGGAARAVAWALRQRGLAVEISARRRAAAAEVAGAVGAVVGDWPPVGGWRLLVNATPVGAWPRPDAQPIPIEARAGQIVYDLVYNPPETHLLREARRGGAQAIGGLAMLVEQAARQWEWWMNRSAARPVMAQAARRFLGAGDDAHDL